ncbi:hypothetical protein BU24DRAFT_161284 [Aaosphaeria arxii CBS 175.79]|uniref:Zn(2)-C6 fungal-type domain-containing protein n=1 Tax=Aaosphaeria arxii CBS 175.79 TaxID=1450172 RepID=A0A6A5XYZ3_9PLEO|nr:uncharacterized protein BU24DRAFT_161284 [Aaosphaeria arxii CBS 175.79]KAF2017850.1 hypothetical protein BU24DRAFT_161284 [Aaosphaeria arxii CBS 175.79]
MPLAPVIAAPARQTMRNAFEELERTVTPADSRNFRSTGLHDVRSAALELENQLGARQALCNMRRLVPLIDGLEHYSNVVGILCNGTPFLPWVWAPITLILKVASEYVEALEEIMKGYSKIAEALGRFAILSDTFVTEADFQQSLAVFYADILLFHKHAYVFVRRSGWKLLFKTSWGRFQRRFNNILEDLKRHGELIDHEANALNIAAAAQMRQEIRSWRIESLNQVKREEENQAVLEFQAIISWLKVDVTEQIQIFETISDEGSKYSGTCSWLLKNESIKSWLQRSPDPPLLWLQGNAGCGKSVIAAKLVDFVQASRSCIVHHFCTYTYNSSTKYDGILKSILQQILRKNSELVAHVYQEYIVGKTLPTTTNLERLIVTLVNSLSDGPREKQYIYMIIDGVNECEAARQTRLINLLKQISSVSSTTSGALCKVLITTRASSIMDKHFRKDHVIYLSDEASPLQSAIRLYINQRLRGLDERFRQLELEREEIDEIEQLVAKKAGGMFLYARLLLDYIKANLFFNGDEIKSAINQLPEHLTEFYQKLLTQILVRLNEQSQDRVRRVYSWIAFAKRPMKKLEFLSALSFTSGDTNLSKLVPKYIVEDTCSPLIEERRDSTISFIHISVKHFLQTPSSALILKEEDAIREHAIASVSCLISGMQVFSKLYNEQTRLLRLIKGVHGLHVYATEYWTEYVLANAALEGGLDGSPKLLDVIKTLAETLDSASVTPLPKLKASTDSLDDRLGLLEKYGTIQTHVENALIARSQKRIESELFQDTIPKKKGTPAESTYLDEVSVTLNAYQKSVETLLDQDSFPGASVEELELFKSHFRTSAYTCRLRSCPHATIGFQTDKLRREHEVAHAGGFRCTFVGCQYPPFRTSKALKTHFSSNHSTDVPAPRKTIRKTGNTSLSGRLRDSALNLEKERKSKVSRSGKITTSSKKHDADSGRETSGDPRQRSPSPSVVTKRPNNKDTSVDCLECLKKRVPCNRQEPICSTCKRWSRTCTYLYSCEQCFSNAVLCDQMQPACRECKSSSVQCFYANAKSVLDGNGSVMADWWKRDSAGPSLWSSDIAGSSGIGTGYLDIILNKITHGVPLEPELYERVKATITNDADAWWKLTEFVDNSMNNSNSTQSFSEIVSYLWSDHPEVAQELNMIIDAGDKAEHTTGIKRSSTFGDDDETEYGSDDEGALSKHIGYCFCNKETSGDMIACENQACSLGWFHLHCVGLVVTPDQGESWFCSDICKRQANLDVTNLLSNYSIPSLQPSISQSPTS